MCPYCSAGCRLGYEISGTTLVQVSRAVGNPGSGGNHCKKGRFGYGHVQSKERLRWPLLRVGRELQETSLDEALRYSSMRLKELTRRVSGDQVAVFVSPRLTNEEIYLAQKLARLALRTHNVTSLTHLVNRELEAPDVVSTASHADIADAQALLVVNTALDEESFAVDIACKQAIRKGARLVYVGPADRVGQNIYTKLDYGPGKPTSSLEKFLAGKSPEERGKFESFHHRVAELAQQLVTQSTQDEILGPRVEELEERLVEQSKLLNEREIELTHLRSEFEIARKAEADLRVAIGGNLGPTRPHNW